MLCFFITHVGPHLLNSCSLFFLSALLHHHLPVPRSVLRFLCSVPFSLSPFRLPLWSLFVVCSFPSRLAFFCSVLLPRLIPARRVIVCCCWCIANPCGELLLWNVLSPASLILDMTDKHLIVVPHKLEQCGKMVDDSTMGMSKRNSWQVDPFVSLLIPTFSSVHETREVHLGRQTCGKSYCLKTVTDHVLILGRKIASLQTVSDPH